MKLTEEQINNASGRRLDADVARFLLGWTNLRTGMQWDAADFDSLYGKSPGGMDSKEHVPPYSTDISAAWKIVEFLRNGSAQRQCLVVQVGGYISAGMGNVPWVVVVSNGITAPLDRAKSWTGQGETAPLAICRAALHAAGVEA